jgi:hypothetical protein
MDTQKLEWWYINLQKGQHTFLNITTNQELTVANVEETQITVFLDRCPETLAWPEPAKKKSR